tara:strand:- start:56578 stop:57132 length:555 start_codon:yes stop_codon:yes gene_type:complete
MNDIVIPMDILNKYNLTINEYLILYNLVNGESISLIFDQTVDQLVKLESKGFVKLSEGEIFLREKVNKIFSVTQDLFLAWLDIYPVKVKKTSSFGSRALSPSGADTIMGKRLRNKWNQMFKKDIKAQETALRVLELHLKELDKSGDLEYMVEAHRWLNEGYHEKYAYLLDEGHSDVRYENEDYM